MKRNLVQAISMAALASITATSAYASTVPVVNASFEDTPATQVNGTSANGTIACTGWTAYIPTAGLYGNYCGSATSGLTTDGLQDAFANDPETGLYQDLGAIQPNTDYHVSVALGSPNNYPSNASAALVNGTDPTGAVLDSVTTPESTSGVLSYYTFDVTTPSNATGDLTIFLSNATPTESAATGEGVQVQFDDVRITSTVVPEPASLGVLSLGAVAFLRRRRR